ncbi:oxaloacetate tautomerase FAHD1, mitochondrial-like [Periplaneta americana]|uniref:oxaloacetate tautomerase FAHD1, mitochondrial-like n=1 Tax=Periplaneta americana TaxID=6978 RepID=UPI0037E9AD86
MVERGASMMTDAKPMFSKYNMSDFKVFGKKILGAGLNYKSLLSEKGLLNPEKPTIFLKPTSSYIVQGQNIEVPEDFEIIQEVELGVVIGKHCKKVSEHEAMEYIAGYCLALDMTNGTVMKESQSQGLPWCLAKGFDTACPVSAFVPLEKIPDPNNIRIWSKVNGKLRQDSNTSDMMFGVTYLVSYISQFMTLEPGDLIITGSPPGMCPVVDGDVIEAGLGDILTVKFSVTGKQQD